MFYIIFKNFKTKIITPLRNNQKQTCTKLEKINQEQYTKEEIVMLENEILELKQTQNRIVNNISLYIIVINLIKLNLTI